MRWVFGGLRMRCKRDGARQSWYTATAILIDGLRSDFRHAGRTLGKRPGFTAIAAASLAIAIGANAAMFAVVDRLMLRRLDVHEPERLVTVSSANAIDSGYAPLWSDAIWNEIRQQVTGVDGILAWSNAEVRSRVDLAPRGQVELVEGLFVDGDFFSTLGVRARHGRVFTSSDDRPGGGPDGPVAVISHRLWQARFGGALDVIGRALTVERVPFTIVGVTPADFHGIEVGRSFDVALPLALEPLVHRGSSWLDPAGPSFLTIMLRLRANQPVEEATARLRALQPSLSRAAFGYEREFQSDPLTLVEAERGSSRLREKYTHPLLAVFLITGLVLFIACANIANLLLARAIARRQELGVRRALGATGWQIARQLLAESLVLVSLGAPGGLLLGVWGSRALSASLSTAASPVALELSADWRLLAFTVGATLAAAVVCGVIPAVRAARVASDTTVTWLSAAHNGSRGRLSTTLMVGQMAVSLLVVVAAGLLVRTFDRLASVELGFDAEQVLLVDVSTPQPLPQPAEQLAYFQRLVDRIATVPGVASVAASSATPLSGEPVLLGAVEVPDEAERDMPVTIELVTPGFFATYGIPLEGRDFNASDRAMARPVAIANEALVRQYTRDRHPIGATVRQAMAPPGQDPNLTIVGVARDAVSRSLRERAGPALYLPFAQVESMVQHRMTISVRASSGSALRLARAVHAEVAAFSSTLSFSSRSLVEDVEAARAQERLVALVSALFGVVALFLAGFGLYAVTAFSVTQRTREIGIRVATGARRGEIITLFLWQAMRTATLGIVIGLGAAALLTRYLAGMLYGLAPLDPLTFVAACALLAAVAACAAVVPAYRATGVDPVRALRGE